MTTDPLRDDVIHAADTMLRMRRLLDATTDPDGTAPLSVVQAMILSIELYQEARAALVAAGWNP